MNSSCKQFALKKLFSSLQLEIKEAGLVQCGDSWQCKNKIWNDNQLYYVIDGEFKLITDGINKIIRQGQMVLIPAGLPVTCEKTAENKLFKYWVKFTSDINSTNIFNLIKTDYIITIDDQKAAEDLFYYMIFKNNCVASEAQIMYRNAYLMMILALYIDNAATGGITLTHSEIDFAKIISYMYDNMHTDISISDISSIAHLSNDYFSQLFKKNFLVSPIKFLNEMRIERAKELLEEYDLTIAEVASKVGFNDISYFNKTFKEIIGYSPKNQKSYTSIT